MIIKRVWAMPSPQTFTIKPIRGLLQSYVKGGWWVDPFAGNNSPASNKNDIDPTVGVIHHLEGLEYLQSIPSNSHDGCLFDPPYSPRQLSEVYKRFGRSVNMQTTQSSYWRKCRDEIARIVKVGGTVISFGWNSCGIGKTRGFEIIEILLVSHGGGHNDTICTVERKIE
jgi:hypothetical protein